MSTFAELVAKPDSTKIVLLELDIGREWTFWVNYDIGVWKVNFDGIYPEILSFTSGFETLVITRIGSVKADGLSLSLVASAADVKSNDSSFFYDSNDKTLYVHCPNGEESHIQLMFIGEAIGVTNHASAINNDAVYSGFPYEPRLLSIPAISKSKDPTFFGKIAYEGGDAHVNNLDGHFDFFGEDEDLFGNAARMLMGFDDLSYSEFRKIFTGYIEDVSIGPEEIVVSIQDKRAQLSREIPPNVFDDTTYPDIKESNVGKPIPLGYGTMRNVPVICTNEDESGSPADYDFKLFDVTDHTDGIKAISKVYVDDVEETPSATSLPNATFSLATADYNPGNKVTCDCQGFVDSDDNPVQNALEVLVDLLTTYYAINFNANFFDMGYWETANTPDIGLFIRKKRKLIDVIEEICGTVQGTFLVVDDGRYAHRLSNDFAAIRQTIERHELLEIPSVKYDPTEVLTSTRVGYFRDWAAGDDEEDHFVLNDEAQKDAIFLKFKTYRSKFFPTLLTTKTAAQTFSDKVLALSGDVKKTFSVRTKTQVIERVLGDLIIAPIKRRVSAFLGNVLAEVIGINKNATGAVVSLDCRMIKRMPETVYEQSTYYGDTYYLDENYGTTLYREVS